MLTAIDADATPQGYNPAPDFEEDTKDPLVDICLTDSTELWLIQWPINKLAAADFNGKELSLKLHRDGQLGSFESSSGKTYNIVSHAAQEPDAIVFTTSAAKSKVVGKLSRRVSLVRYPEPSEYEKKPSSNRTNLSNLKSGGSRRRSMSLRDTLTSTHTAGQRSGETSQKSRKRRHKGMMAPSEGSESHITDASLGSQPYSGEKWKGKKRKIMVEE